MPPSTHPGTAPAALWRRAALLAAAAAATAGLAGCSSRPSSSGPSTSAPATTIPNTSPSPSPSGPSITVMTRNMYFGADLSPLFSATAAQLGTKAAAAYLQLQQSDVPARLQADAKEIASAKPDLVALQEAVIWSELPSGNRASKVVYDFVTGLKADLSTLGSPYTVAASSNGFSGALPVPGVGLVALQDRDVILVRAHDSRLSVSHPTNGIYRHYLTVHVAGFAIKVKRGWAAVDASAGGRQFHVIATHLEAYSNPVRDAQAQELLTLVRDDSEPTLVLGDVNSPASGAGSATYDAVRNAGLGDAWAAANPGASGFTCCRAADLRSGSLTQRIDMIFTRGAFKVGRAWLVGAAPSDRTPGGLWPSDHAGVVATLVPPA